MSMLLVPGKVTLAQLETIWRDGLAVRLDDGARADIDRAAGLVVAHVGAATVSPDDLLAVLP